MGVRIIAGELRGRRLEVEDLPGLRPTTDRVRETIFNMIAHRMDFEGTRVLDLFAGSGALGIEALSRGAAHVDFVEKGGAGVRLIRRNLDDLDLQERATIIRGDVFRTLDSLGRYDLILADPPYGLRQINELCQLFPDHLLPEGYAMIERGTTMNDPGIDRLEFIAERKTGNTWIFLFQG